jgi:protein gp37
MKREWVMSARRQCREQSVPFFFKQWGGVRKSRAGRILNGRTYDEMPIQQGEGIDAIAPLVRIAGGG